MTPGRPLLTRLVVVLGILLVGLGGYLIWNRSSDGPGDQQPKSSPESPGKAEEELTTFKDEVAGFTVRYPRSWAIVRSREGDPQVKLVAGPVGSRDYLLVRVIPLPAPVYITAKTPEEDIGQLQAQLDKFIEEAPDVGELVERKRLNLNGLPGWYYLYTFKDPATGQEGVHSHFFLFDGAQMDVLVFQALPKGDFRRLSPTFDRILETFESVRPRAGATPRPQAAAPSPAP